MTARIKVVKGDYVVQDTTYDGPVTIHCQGDVTVAGAKSAPKTAAKKTGGRRKKS